MSTHFRFSRIIQGALPVLLVCSMAAFAQSRFCESNFTQDTHKCGWAGFQR